MTKKQTIERRHSAPPTRCVRGREVAEMLDISLRTLYRKVAKGEFPGPIRIGEGTTRWRLRDVQIWLDGRKARRSSHLAASPSAPDRRSRVAARLRSTTPRQGCVRDARGRRINVQVPTIEVG